MQPLYLECASINVLIVDGLVCIINKRVRAKSLSWAPSVPLMPSLPLQSMSIAKRESKWAKGQRAFEAWMCVNASFEAE